MNFFGLITLIASIAAVGVLLFWVVCGIVAIVHRVRVRRIMAKTTLAREDLNNIFISDLVHHPEWQERIQQEFFAEEAVE